MAVDGHDRPRREFDEVKRLPADSTTQIEDRRRRWQVVTETDGPCRAGTIARTLPGQGFVDLEEDLPEAWRGFVHATCAS